MKILQSYSMFRYVSSILFSWTDFDLCQNLFILISSNAIVKT